MRAVAATLALSALALAIAGCGGATKPVAPPPVKRSPSGPVVAVVLSSSGSLVARLGGDGSIAAAAPDSHGGWFVAGSFTHLDGVSERGLAHVLGTGAIDPRWHGALSSSGRTALVAADATLYAAGSIADTDRSRVLALDASTGALRKSFPAPPGPVAALAVYGTHLIIATSASTVRARPSCIEALDTGSGRPQSAFAADVRPAPEQGCIGIVRLDGASLYLAGAFHAVGGVPRAGLAKLDASTGRLESAWKPPAAGSAATIYDIAPSAGGVVIAGSSPALALLSVRSGSPQRQWRAPSTIRNPLSLAVVGDQVFVAGDFNGGVARVRLPTGSGLPSWRAAAGQSGGPVVASGSNALVGIHRR